MATEKRLIEYGSAVGQIQKLHMDAFRRRDKAQSEAYKKAWDILMDAPTVDAVEVVHGRWHDVYMTSPTTYTATCSVCNVRNDIPHPWRANYCPNCGAKMDGERRE